jgi:hypothetical protein
MSQTLKRWIVNSASGSRMLRILSSHCLGMPVFRCETAKNRNFLRLPKLITDYLTQPPRKRTIIYTFNTGEVR